MPLCRKETVMQRVAWAVQVRQPGRGGPAFICACLTPKFTLFPRRSTTCAVWAQIVEGGECQHRFSLWVFRCLCSEAFYNMVRGVLWRKCVSLAEIRGIGAGTMSLYPLFRKGINEKWRISKATEILTVHKQNNLVPKSLKMRQLQQKVTLEGRRQRT